MPRLLFLAQFAPTNGEKVTSLLHPEGRAFMPIHTIFQYGKYCQKTGMILYPVMMLRS